MTAQAWRSSCWVLWTATVVWLAAGCAPAAEWRVVGPGGGGAMFLPTVSPHDTRTVLVACDMTGAYITRDGGESWRMFNLRRRVTWFAFDPRDPKVIYAHSSGLWRSRDTGTAWDLVYPRPESIRAIRRNDDHAEDVLVTAQGDAAQFRALAVDPGDSRVLYGLREEDKVRLVVSRDDGANWTVVREVDSGARWLHIDARSPRGNRTLYVPGTAMVEVVEGGRWERRPNPPGITFHRVSAGFSRQQGAFIIYGITENKVWISGDGGQHWRRSYLPGWSTELETVAAAERDADTGYVSVRKLRAPLDWVYGVARTVNRGRTWELVWRDGDRLAANVTDGWVTERFGPGFAGNPVALGVAPRDPEIVYATDLARTMRSLNGGRTWEQVYSRRTPGGGWTTRGLDVTTNYGVHFDPFNPRRMFISYTDIGLFRSEDAGASWVSATAGVPKRWGNTTYWMVSDPEVPGRMWGVMSGTHDLPRTKMWQHRAVTSYQGGVCRSDDGGRTWQPSWEGAPETAATHILLDARSAKEERVLWVAGFGRGVFQSVNGGKSWRPRNQGLPENEPLAWRLAQDASGTLYVILARRREDGGVRGEGDGALYRLSAGAEQWKRVPLPPGVNGPNGLAIDPRDPRKLYLACWGRPGEQTAVDGGIYHSEDSGASWRRIFADDQYVYDVTIDPKNPQVLYAAGFSSSAWRSTDAGRTWQRIRGFNFKWGHRATPDPLAPGMLYITTFGGGVWHGPAAGVANAVEDIVTPVVAYGK